MLFPSAEFLFLFLPIVWLLSLLGGLKTQNRILCLFSLVFYALTDLQRLPLFLFVLLFTYLFGRLLYRRNTKPLLFFGVAVLLGILIFYKYLPPLSALLSPLGLPVLSLTLPIGISFYSFQAISYLADIARGDVIPEKSPIAFLTYLAFFPQLIAGPIVRYSDVATALYERTPAREEGTYRFLTGIMKKVLIADAMGVFFSEAMLRDAGALYLFFGLLAASFQIYFDFSGYSDMAIGLGLIFGFRFPENFRYPYIADSGSEFWRRWHITLSSFFKSYVYIPLGGNRRGKARTALNLLFVWSLTGLWHGAAPQFLLWGIFWFCVLAAEKLTPFGSVLARLPRPLRHLYSLTLILFGWWLFSFPSLTHAVLYAKRLFTSSFITAAGGFDILRFLPIFLLAGLCSTPLPARLLSRLRKTRPHLSAALLLSGFCLSLSFLFYRDYSPFLYFRF